MPHSHSQNSIAASLLDPEKGVPAGLIAPGNIDIQKRFSVYRNNVMSSLVSALATAFPTVEKIVGEEFFKAMAAIFIRKHPPESPVLMLYGEKFPEFLMTFEPVSALPYLPDVARLEQMRRQVYHAPDASSVPAGIFSEISQAELDLAILSLHPASEVAAFNSPAVSIWNWNNLSEGEAKPGIPSGRENVLIWRQRNEVRMHLLSPGIELFLRQLKLGIPLGESARAADAIPGFDLTAALTTLFETRLITGIDKRS